MAFEFLATHPLFCFLFCTPACYIYVLMSVYVVLHKIAEFAVVICCHLGILPAALADIYGWLALYCTTCVIHSRPLASTLHGFTYILAFFVIC